MKTIKNQILLLISLLFLFSFTACDSDHQNKKEVKSKLEQKVEQFKGKLKAEQKELKAELKETLNDFNDELTGFEEKLENSGEKLDENRQKALDKLKMQGQLIEEKTKKAKNISEENWEEFKSNIIEERKEFQQAMKVFFESEKEK